MAETTTPATPTAATAGDTLDEQIHFDTLWSTAQDAMTVYGGRRWTARGDHDPGVTLLQALSFGVSDVSYRHTLPLTDLLTPPTLPKPSDSTPGPVTVLDHTRSGIFAYAFGPETALTCGPVTLDDYRRAILDLTGPPPTEGDHKDGARTDAFFCFRDVQIAALKKEASYGYKYDANTYAFRFLSTDDEAKKNDAYRVSGHYRLWVTLNPGVTQKDAETVLQKYLKGNRNLCEQEIRDIKYLSAENVPDHTVVLDLDDDVTADRVPLLIAQALWAVNDVLLPGVKRQQAAERLVQGEAAETIYEGPKLEHGWIKTLPRSRVDRDGALEVRTVPLQTLSSAMSGVAGIKQVTWPNWKGPLTITIPVANQVQLGVNWATGELAKDVATQIIITKRGQVVFLKEKLTDCWKAAGVEWRKLVDQAKKPVQELKRQVPYGRYRHPGFYRTAGSWLPPLYGLQQAPEVLANNHDARTLLQFLRPFEQLLANSADQLAQLPHLLAFDGRNKDAHVWGAADWPKPDEDPLAAGQTEQVLGQGGDSSIHSRLKSFSEQSAKDDEKELAIVDYLLGYFGERRAPRALVGNATGELREQHEFRAVQQGFLRQITRLSYERATISISKISALQRRIAARLGTGEMLFDEKLQKPGTKIPQNLPFYLIEHQELLPVAPNPEQVTPDWPAGQTATRNDDSPDTLTLTLSSANPVKLERGQLIELRGSTGDTKTPFLEPITAIVIHQVSNESTASVDVEIDLREHVRLKRSVEQLKNASYKWNWRLSPTWLKRVVYDLSYVTVPESNPTQVELNVSPSFPVGLKPGDRLALRPKARWQTPPMPSEVEKTKPYNDIVVEVMAVDPIRGRATVKWVYARNFTHGESPSVQVDPVDLRAQASGPIQWPDAQKVEIYGWSVPYTNEAFSFTLSVVLNRDWLQAGSDANELNQWIEQIVRDEVPSHLNVQLHWLDNLTFADFANKYNTWQENDRPLGDQSFELMSLLGIGARPTDDRAGIGFVQIARQDQKAALESIPDNTDSKVRLRAFRDKQVVYVASDAPGDNLPELRFWY